MSTSDFFGRLHHITSHVDREVERLERQLQECLSASASEDAPPTGTGQEGGGGGDVLAFAEHVYRETELLAQVQAQVKATMQQEMDKTDQALEQTVRMFERMREDVQEAEQQAEKYGHRPKFDLELDLENAVTKVEMKKDEPAGEAPSVFDKLSLEQLRRMGYTFVEDAAPIQPISAAPPASAVASTVAVTPASLADLSAASSHAELTPILRQPPANQRRPAAAVETPEAAEMSRVEITPGLFVTKPSSRGKIAAAAAAAAAAAPAATPVRGGGGTRRAFEDDEDGDSDDSEPRVPEFATADARRYLEDARKRQQQMTPAKPKVIKPVRPAEPEARKPASSPPYQPSRRDSDGPPPMPELRTVDVRKLLEEAQRNRLIKENVAPAPAPPKKEEEEVSPVKPEQQQQQPVDVDRTPQPPRLSQFSLSHLNKL